MKNKINNLEFKLIIVLFFCLFINVFVYSQNKSNQIDAIITCDIDSIAELDKISRRNSDSLIALVIRKYVRDKVLAGPLFMLSDEKYSSIGVYENGKYNGPIVTFFENGNIERIQYIINDSLTNVSLFYENGNLKKTGMYKHSTMFGKWMQFHENGKIKSISNYILLEITSDNINNPLYVFRDYNNYNTCYFCLEDGYFYNYDLNGVLISVQLFEKGKLLKTLPVKYFNR